MLHLDGYDKNNRLINSFAYRQSTTNKNVESMWIYVDRNVLIKYDGVSHIHVNNEGLFTLRQIVDYILT